MKKKMPAKDTKEFDQRFDKGEDIHDLIDMSKATIMRTRKKVRITIDIAETLVNEIDEIRQTIVAETLVNEIDEIRQTIGVDRGALIKIWLHERVKQEKGAA
ncbi:MAG: CopG family transcriptional regulator [Nitrospirae bacterium]|nr:CopG family transcriptional regulator [Nitrospirota bacterium]